MVRAFFREWWFTSSSVCLREWIHTPLQHIGVKHNYVLIIIYFSLNIVGANLVMGTQMLQLLEMKYIMATFSFLAIDVRCTVYAP